MTNEERYQYGLRGVLEGLLLIALGVAILTLGQCS